MTRSDDDRPVTPPPDPPPTSAAPQPISPQPTSASGTDFDRDFAEEYESIAESLNALDARYRQIRRDRQQRDRLQADRRALSNSQATTQDREELTQIRDRLELLELNLESSLFHWSGLREPIWFGLRYGGLGFILGWLLHACTQ